MTGIEGLIAGILGAIVQAAPGFLAAFSGKADDAEAIAHARRVAARFAPVAGKLRARSAAARAAAARVTEDDVRRARTIAGSPSTGAAHTASILALAALAEVHLEDERATRADEPTGKIGG